MRQQLFHALGEEFSDFVTKEKTAQGEARPPRRATALPPNEKEVWSVLFSGCRNVLQIREVRLPCSFHNDSPWIPNDMSVCKTPLTNLSSWTRTTPGKFASHISSLVSQCCC